MSPFSIHGDTRHIPPLRRHTPYKGRTLGCDNWAHRTASLENIYDVVRNITQVPKLKGEDYLQKVLDIDSWAIGSNLLHAYHLATKGSLANDPETSTSKEILFRPFNFSQLITDRVKIRGHRKSLRRNDKLSPKPRLQVRRIEQLFLLVSQARLENAKSKMYPLEKIEKVLCTSVAIC